MRFAPALLVLLAAGSLHAEPAAYPVLQAAGAEAMRTVGVLAAYQERCHGTKPASALKALALESFQKRHGFDELGLIPLSMAYEVGALEAEPLPCSDETRDRVIRESAGAAETFLRIKEQK